MQRKLDIFISYRRDDGAQYARILQLKLVERGYRVFLDYDELTDGIFGEKIRKAIDEAPIFIAILSQHYLERCVNEHDWVRNEFKLALQKKKFFIFVNPDNSFEGIPDETPENIANTISRIPHSEISFGQALDATIDLLVMHRIEPILGISKERETWSSSKRSDRTISDVFISYCRDDKLEVHPFVEYISKAISKKCWIDLKGIESGDEFEDVIIRAIDECQVVLFMLSDNSLKSKWTKREVLYAEGEGKRIVPVLVNGDKLRGWFKFHFGNVDYIDINSDEQKEKLIANLKYWLAIEEEKSNAEITGRDETKCKKTRRIIEGQKTVKESKENIDKNAKQETNESGTDGIVSEEIVIPSDIAVGKFTWVLKLNETTKNICDIWNRVPTLYKWLTYFILLFIVLFKIYRLGQSENFEPSFGGAETRDSIVANIEVSNNDSTTCDLDDSNSKSNENTILLDPVTIHVSIDSSRKVTANKTIANNVMKNNPQNHKNESITSSIPLCPNDKHPHLIDLGLPSGTKWRCCNIGASNPEGYGDVFSWGEVRTKASYEKNTHSNYSFFQTKIDQGDSICGTRYDAAYVRLGHNWTMPTYAQCEELVTKCSFRWISINGINGGEFTGPNGRKIFLPAAGCILSNLVIDRGTAGCYWSSSKSKLHTAAATTINFNRNRKDQLNECTFDGGNYIRPVSRKH